MIVGPWAAAATYAGISLVLGLLLTSLFSINHMGMPSTRPGDRRSYLRRQVETSRNIDVPAALTFLFGGLNYQIEHHLFPSMGYPRLRASRCLVQAFCHENGLAYHAEGLFSAYRALHRHLTRIGATAQAHRVGAAAAPGNSPRRHIFLSKAAHETPST
jgi:fatty acid desaturase